MSSGPVVVGYDSGSSGADALTLGTGLGSALGRTVIVAKVHSAPAPIGAGRVDAEWVADRRSASAAVLTQARAQVDSSRPGAAGDVEYRLVPSTSAAHGLHDLAVEVDASFVVVGSAATEGFDRRVFAGSTASRLLSGAECPVAIAPKGLAGEGWGPPATLGVAYLATAEGTTALRAAAAVARATGAGLHLYTAVAPEAAVVPWLVGVDGENAFRATVAETVQTSLDEAVASVADETAGLEVTASLLVGDVVARLADLPGVDLLFCGSRGYGPVRRVLLGGVSSRLVRRATSPVVVLPRPH
jgi:nucleotide-binding universal stress UspA family protein